jgi:hypothetical protein
MATLTFDTFLPAVALSPAATSAGTRDGDAIARGVRQALAAAQPLRSGLERRREARHPFPYPIHLTPVTKDGRPDVDRTLVVIGKHLSEHGIDFYHPQPVPFSRVIASLETRERGWVGLLLELTWCRFTRHGWYDNGGRFLSLVASPLAMREPLSTETIGQPSAA